MFIHRSTYWLSVILMASGCGGHERMEALQLAKVLKEQASNFSAANATERDLVNNARSWCGGITSNGSGKGAELDQNAVVATELAKSAVAASGQLGKVRQAIDGLNLTEEFPQHVRDQLITQLTKRQRTLQDVRALLDASEPQFHEYQKMKAYAGDSYPDGVSKLDALMHAYKPPDDALGAALSDLQSKYSFKPGEI